MSLASTDARLGPSSASPIERRNWKTPIIFGVLTLLALLLFVVQGSPDAARFALSTRGDALQFDPVPVSGMVAGIVTTLVLLSVTVFSAVLVQRRQRVPFWAVVAGSVFGLFGFLAWAATGQTLQVPGLLAGAITLAIPLIFGGMGGVISERVGVVNIAIEGQLLAGAFTAAVVASLTGSAIAGLLGAGVAGMLVSFVLAAFSIKYLVDQVIVGVVINVLVTGLTNFLYSSWLTAAPEVNSPALFQRLPIPLLEQIPVLGPALFRQTLLVYFLYAVVAIVAFGLAKTRWGLRLRAVGEHPQAADTVGIDVNSTRFWNVSLAGAIAGFGGAFLALSAVGSFQREMTAGDGFIALAAVIFGRWQPIRVMLAALLFGFAKSLQNALGLIGSSVPSEILLMLPYLVTIFAVAGLVGASRGPAAAGTPYIKG